MPDIESSVEMASPRLESGVARHIDAPFPSGRTGAVAVKGMMACRPVRVARPVCNLTDQPDAGTILGLEIAASQLY